MAPTQTLLSPAELSFLHDSLSLHPPIRQDLRNASQFRPLVAETDLVPTTNGSARICFSDGTEAIVGVKAELTKTSPRSFRHLKSPAALDSDMEADAPPRTPGRNSIEVSVDIPGQREDDALPVFLSSLLTEALTASPQLSTRLQLNARWHWKLYIDVLLLSPPLAYPLPLLSLTVHLALRATRLPRLTSEPQDDPLFDDDWDAAEPLYAGAARPPVTLLVAAVSGNILFDPTGSELAVADAAVAVSFAATAASSSSSTKALSSTSPALSILATRTIDPPSRLTAPGVPDALNPATAAGASANAAQAAVVPPPPPALAKAKPWTPPRGGVPRALLSRIVHEVVRDGGVGAEVLAALAGVQT